MMRKCNLKSQRGVSLVEVLIVLVVLGILTTMAVLQLRGARTNLERQRIVREFKNYLERARFDSVKRRAVTNGEMATIVLNGPTSFSATMDFDESGTVAAGETRDVDFTRRSTTQILVSDTLNYPVTIRFDRRGHATAIDNGNTAVNPVFKICGDCSTGSNDVSFLSISASGTVADTRTAPGTLPTPPITNTNTLFNCYVLVMNTNSACINL
jgi:prepilin-type N-terminal cleavage/methylation domain-containing protein